MIIFMLEEKCVEGVIFSYWVNNFREKTGRSIMNVLYFYLTHVECGDPSHQETDQALHYPIL